MTGPAFDFGPGTRAVTLQARPLAYVDSRFSGPLPCRIIGAARVMGWGPHVWAPALQGGIVLAVEYTAARGPYAKGAREAWPVGQVVPRGAVSFGRFGYTIWPYRWADDLPELAALAALPELPAIVQ